MALPYPTLPGDIDHLIADDHAIVERQFQHLEAGRGDLRTLVDQVSFELAMHAFAEETVLYPVWGEVGMVAANQDARSEHNHMNLLRALCTSAPSGASAGAYPSESTVTVAPASPSSTS